VNYLSDISKEQISLLDTAVFPGKIHLIDRPELVASAVNALSVHSLLGFDTETKPSFRKGQIHKVSLLQLSTGSEAYLFRISHTGLTDSLMSLLQNPLIGKVGVAVNEDIRKLQVLRNFSPAGFIELQDYSSKYGIESNSLRKLAAIVVGVRISKSQQTSNWETPVLDEHQMLYAATDAWISLEIYKRLNGHPQN
jgi:ribonuclease D